jgi:4'-phosphopantetheinyl transferase EntD
VAAPAARLRGIGLDAEGADPLEADLVPLVCGPEDLAGFAGLPSLAAVDWPKLAFSAKEAWFKCQWPVRGHDCELRDVQVAFAPEPSGRQGRFRILADWAGDAARRCEGAWMVAAGRVHCGAAWPAGDAVRSC